MTAVSAKDPVQLSLQDEIATLTINRPHAENALTPRSIDTISLMLEALEADGEIKVLILEGAGANFCAGEDLTESEGIDDPEMARHFRARTAKLMQRISAYPKIVIAKVRGAAHGLGLDMVLGADLAFASHDASFGTPTQGSGSSQWTSMVPLSRSVGQKHALRMLLGGTPVPAGEAASMGLISQAVAAEALDDTVTRIAKSIATTAPHLIRLAKQDYQKQLTMTLEDAYAFAIEGGAGARSPGNSGFRPSRQVAAPSL
ncbi:enoyl-CoA hydratase/carnithine racemase [Rhodoligotrophos appendicifer]|uniref:enoyl-CoA hydratase/isomerase family protein n=1 Tax=Rhodoligotrophos appendicifer TaxID=987056 RepID=UPI0011869B40|nr:enoyl-CoA hydratase-related protein [Rhodoligotrophos appendicifer]